MRTKRLTNDECIPLIRSMTAFSNRSESLTGKRKDPGTSVDGFGNLPGKYYELVREATFVVFSYHTPIAWFGPKVDTTHEGMMAWLDSPTAADLAAYMDGEVDTLRTPPFPCTEPLWQMPPVRYSITTSDHQHVVMSALAYEKTWREAEDQKAIAAPHYAATEYALTAYNDFQRVDSSTGRAGSW